MHNEKSSVLQQPTTLVPAVRGVGRAHAIVLAILLGLFTLVYFLLARAGHADSVVLPALGALAGPLAGALARNCQNCCLRVSLQLMAWCAPILLAAIAFQFLRLPGTAWLKAVRLGVWGAGWLAWFLGGILAFGHALT
ncbi:MAG: hypothetical protein WC708_06090 [Lentisphaeria bacterium]